MFVKSKIKYLFKEYILFYIYLYKTINKNKKLNYFHYLIYYFN